MRGRGSWQVSSDGRYLAAGGVDRSIHVWDVRTHQYLRAFAGHRGTVSVSIWPPTVKAVVSCVPLAREELRLTAPVACSC